MLPNKVINVDESVIWKLPIIIDELKKADQSVETLFKKVGKKFRNINEFIFCLETLYVLDKVDFNDEYRMLKYAD